MEFKEVVLYASDPIDNGTQLREALKNVEEYARIALNTGRTVRVGATGLESFKDADRKALDL